MSRLRPGVINALTAVAIPVGMAAAFAFQIPAASAASSAPARAVVAAQAAATSVTGYRDVPRLRAYRWAVTQKGHPYVWGGTGPGYDCSGLVMMAYRHAGISLPRTTFGMLASPLLVRVIHPRMGDLAFYGTGHVELFRRWGYTFGAHDYGTTVGLIHYGWGWKPTAFYRVR
jgi:cell wall-associated NlpC family hydrolase